MKMLRSKILCPITNVCEERKCETFCVNCAVRQILPTTTSLKFMEVCVTCYS
ncbi:hypothetical protein AHF37_11555 [Paragonimus kellicotti]|nr:hypothetical protein AHF37_11555 [Paragonimus kellicotti]